MVLSDVLPIILFTIVTVLVICTVFFAIVDCCSDDDLHDEYPVTILPTTVIVTTETAGQEELDAIPTFRYCTCGGPAGDQQVEECAVCLERFELLQKMRRLPGCGHCFHAECIDAWLRRNPTCPICRRRLDFEHVVVVVLAPTPNPNPNPNRNLTPRALPQQQWIEPRLPGRARGRSWPAN